MYNSLQPTIDFVQVEYNGHACLKLDSHFRFDSSVNWQCSSVHVIRRYFSGVI